MDDLLGYREQKPLKRAVEERMGNGNVGVQRGSIACVGALVLSLAACSGGGGLSPLSPGALGGPVASATSSPSPTPAPVAGGPVIGTPTFPSGGSGNCTTGLLFTGSGQTAVMSVSEAGYTGAFSVGKNEAPTVASVAVSGSTVTVTALANGTDFFTVVDSSGRAAGCNLGTTITTGSAS